jgi:hypothetical protein
LSYNPHNSHIHTQHYGFFHSNTRDQASPSRNELEVKREVVEAAAGAREVEQGVQAEAQEGEPREED